MDSRKGSTQGMTQNCGEMNVKQFKKWTHGLIFCTSICLSPEDCTVPCVIFHCYHGNSLLQFWFAVQCDTNVPQQLLLVLSFWQAQVAVMYGASAIGDGTLFAQHAQRESRQTVEMFQD